MRRPALILVLVLVAAVVAVALFVVRDDGNATARIDIVFDTAKGMLPGQNVKVAGTKVGEIEKVRLERTPGRGFKARMELSIDERFVPFYADASCRILPEGAISENYIECDPGSPRGGVLGRGPSGTPTVALAHTEVPASIQDVFNTFTLDTTERLRLLLNNLGLATAGRGEDINGILRRANPALTQSRKVLAIVGDQSRELGRAVAQTDTVIARLAERRADIRGFVRNAAAASETTASHSGALSEAVRRLPPTLDTLDRTLAPVKNLVAMGTPLLADLRRAAPGLTQLNIDLPAFSRVGDPGLEALGKASGTGARALRTARPVAKHLAELAKVADPNAKRLDELLTSVRDQGGFEGFGDLFYGLSNAGAGYDATSHYISIIANVYPACILLANVPGKDTAPGCSHTYYAPGNGQIPATQDAGMLQIPKSEAGRRQDIEALLDYLLK